MPPLFGVTIGTYHGDDHRVRLAIGDELVELTPDEAEGVAKEIQRKAGLARRARARSDAKAARERVFR